MRCLLSLLCLSIFIPACGMDDFRFGTPVTISSFTSNLDKVIYGQPAVLSWTLDGNPTKLTLDDASLLGRISVAVHPARRQSYTLAASTPLGGDTRTLTVAAEGVDLLAGSTGGAGTVDGAGSAARFNHPMAIASGYGQIQVADTLNHTIRTISPQGVVTTLAGSPGTRGSADGRGAAARFNSPGGIAVASTYVYVADTENHTIRRITLPDGGVITLAGLAGAPGGDDGTGSSARFRMPRGLAADDFGNVYVADTYNSTIRKITSSGVVTTLAGLAGWPGTADGIGSSARFAEPSGVALDGGGNIYVAERQRIRKVTQSGEVSTLASDLSIWTPSIALDGSANIYVVDPAHTGVLKITGQSVSYLAGSDYDPGLADGTGGAARFASPSGITFDGSGRFDGSGDLYVTDALNCTIRKVSTAGVVTTLAGLGGYANIDGAGSDARISSPRGIAVDPSGNLYVANHDHPAQIRKITPLGVVTTFFSAAPIGDSSIYRPFGIAIDGSGNVYVADAGSNRIQKFSSDAAVETLAGSVNSGSDDGFRSGARFNNPSGIALANSGNLYVADTSNHTIRVVTLTGTVSTLAGLAGVAGSANGSGVGARFNSPYGIAVDDLNNIYVADTFNHTIRIVTPLGAVSTLAGSPGLAGSADGQGSAARFNYPYSVAVSRAGYVYVADTYNHTIRKVGLDGVVTTIGGVAGSGGPLPGWLPGRLAFPYGVALTRAGDLVVTNPAGVMQLTF